MPPAATRPSQTLPAGIPEQNGSLRARMERRITGFVMLAILFCLLVLVSIAVGARPISLPTVVDALLHPDAGRDALVVWQLRLPRTALGIVVGAALGLAGALMQALTRNPLADPGLLGINAGASFCVVIAISLFGITSYSGLVWFAIFGAMAVAVLVYLLAMSPASSVERVRLILAGAAISASLGAVTGIITMVDTQAFDSYRFWVVGALNGQTVESLWQVIPFAASGGLIGLALSGQLNAVALGDDVARALGVRLGLLKAAGFASIALLCGAATAAAGPIGFVGLVIPHALRLLLGPDWRWVLPYSLLAGPILVLASDIVGRVIAPPGEIEVGIVTAFIGAPVLLKLVTSARKERP